MNSASPQLCIGLMSGTSMDGIDASLIETDGENHLRPRGGHMMAYTPEFRRELRAAVEQARALGPDRVRDGDFSAIEQKLTKLHIEAVGELLRLTGNGAKDISLIGMHGHTLLHSPTHRLSLQIGDGALLARATGIDVVHDLRAADIAAGGQGAPLVPIYHQALSRVAQITGPAIFVNIGGVANLSYVGGDTELLAFDIGPGNALIDDWLHRHQGPAYDDQGRIAAEGTIDQSRLDDLLTHRFFSQSAPKSLDRNAFSAQSLTGLNLADGAATLTAFTAAAVAKAVALLPQPPRACYVCGGGRHNDTLMKMLAARLAMTVARVEALGFDGDLLEAEAFAYLARRSVRGLAISFPGTTGAPRTMTGGKWVKA